MRTFSASLVVLAVVALAAGCGGEEQTEPEVLPTPPATGTATATASPTPARVPCPELLTLDQAARAAGVVLASPREAPIGSLPACRWDAPDGKGALLATSAPASDWVAGLPAVLDTLEASPLAGNANVKARIALARKQLESGDYASDQRGCELFRTFLRIQYPDLPDDRDHVVLFVPNPSAPQAVTGQACLNGRFRSVTWSGPDIVGDQATSNRIRRALLSDLSG